MLTIPLLLHTATEGKNGKSYILETGIGLLWLTKLYTINCEYSTKLQLANDCCIANTSTRRFYFACMVIT
jgi:hypothetical protein